MLKEMLSYTQEEKNSSLLNHLTKSVEMATLIQKSETSSVNLYLDCETAASLFNVIDNLRRFRLVTLVIMLYFRAKVIQSKSSVQRGKGSEPTTGRSF